MRVLSFGPYSQLGGKGDKGKKAWRGRTRETGGDSDQKKKGDGCVTFAVETDPILLWPGSRDSRKARWWEVAGKEKPPSGFNIFPAEKERGFPFGGGRRTRT